jgi:hypothetical protein
MKIQNSVDNSSPRHQRTTTLCEMVLRFFKRTSFQSDWFRNDESFVLLENISRCRIYINNQCVC